MKRRTIQLIALAGALASGLPAAAQESGQPAEGEPANMLTPFGMAFTVGGGVSDFVRDQIRDFTQTGGGWEARYVLGTRTHLGAEAAYTASLNGLDTLGVDDNAMLMSNGGEAMLRANILTGAWQPYLLAGVGWRHYNVVNTDTNTSDVSETDDAMTIPMAVGVSYRYSRIVGDLRAAYRPSFFDDISAVAAQPLDSAALSLNIGFEF